MKRLERRLQLIVAAALASTAVHCVEGAPDELASDPPGGSAGSGGQAGGETTNPGGVAGAGASTGGQGGGGGSAAVGGAGSGSASCGVPSHFNPVPHAWTLPAPRCQVSFDAFGDDGPISYALLDLIGGPYPDLVVFDDACDDQVGRVRWDVYEGGEVGANGVPSSYALPPSRCQAAFDAAARGHGSLRYGLIDLVGDDHADLVVFADACDDDIGRVRWDVYAGAEGGFEASPQAFSIPAARCQRRFDAMGDGGGGVLRFGLLDLTHDGAMDLVVFADACDDEVGSLRWDVYRGGADGFSLAPETYGLPAPRCQQLFDRPSSSGSLPLGFVLLDLTADGRADLVVTRDDCDDAIGHSRWDVYVSGEYRFEPQPVSFEVPAPRCNTRFEALAGVHGGVGYGLMDLTCDGLPELVVTRDGCDDGVGATGRDVYRAAYGGFSAAPFSLAVPTTRCQVSFDAF